VGEFSHIQDRRRAAFNKVPAASASFEKHRSPTARGGPPVWGINAMPGAPNMCGVIQAPTQICGGDAQEQTMIISAPSDYRKAAERHLPRFLFDYIDGGR
jgi:hypothetical protein